MCVRTGAEKRPKTAERIYSRRIQRFRKDAQRFSTFIPAGSHTSKCRIVKAVQRGTLLTNQNFHPTGTLSNLFESIVFYNPLFTKFPAETNLRFSITLPFHPTFEILHLRAGTSDWMNLENCRAPFRKPFGDGDVWILERSRATHPHPRIRYGIILCGFRMIYFIKASPQIQI